MTDTDHHTSAMVDAVRGMSQELRDYTQHADAERATLLEAVNATVVAMRTDVFATTSRIQLDMSQHRDEHSAERKERAVDAVDRLNRQLVLNLWLGALTGLLVFVIVLVAVVLVRQVMDGR